VLADPPLGPDAASFDAAPPAIHETHISVVVLVGDRAVKLKKPVALPFLDWRTRAAREAACHREVDLNRRLAADVYLGVADITGPGGELCDHLVVMRRMPEERSLARLVAAGADVRVALDALAARLVAFHAGASRSPAINQAASRDGVRQNWDDNLSVLEEAAATLGDPAAVHRVDVLAHSYLTGRGPLFADRAEAGMAVDGHGDLLADDVYLLDDGPRILDCLEFDDRLRAVDVLDDAAFLAMDLERLGAPSLGAWFLDAYRRHSGGHHPASLAHHYVAYRAGVRAKVACIRAGQGVPAAVGEARDLLDLARRHLEAGRVRMVVVGGLPGTGKSTLARRLADRAGWAVLRSDEVRKELAGVEPSAHMAAAFAEGIYRPDFTEAAYGELLLRARQLLERGESVVLDASWTDAARRAEAAALADATVAELVELRCDAPAEVAAGRMGHREVGDPSDATPAVAAAMAASADPWPTAVVIDTTADPETAEAAAADALGLDASD
jgi:aminoglycoside phosphotransferase family enzyme/adenylate kinase family enzyme